jgi:hypothetical protein
MMDLLKDYAQRKPFRSFSVIMQPYDGENPGPPHRLTIDKDVRFLFVNPDVAIALGKDAVRGKWACYIGRKSILAISHDEGKKSAWEEVT